MAVPSILDHVNTIGNGSAEHGINFDLGLDLLVGDLIYFVTYTPADAGDFVDDIWVWDASETNHLNNTFQLRKKDGATEIWWGLITTASVGGSPHLRYTKIADRGDFVIQGLVIRGASSADPFDPNTDLPKFVSASSITFDTDTAGDQLLLGYGLKPFANGELNYMIGWVGLDRVDYFTKAAITASSLDASAAQVGTAASAATGDRDPPTIVFVDCVIPTPPALIEVAQTIPAFGQAARGGVPTVSDADMDVLAGRIILVEIDTWQQ